MSRQSLFEKFKNSSISEIIPEKEEKNIIRIIQYNVNLWKEFDQKTCNFDSIIKFISSSDCDIICFNESLFNVKKSPLSKDKFDSTMKKCGFLYIVHCHPIYGINSLCSKIPFSSHQVIHLGKDPVQHQNRYCLKVEFQQPSFNLYLAHLDAFDNSEKTRKNQMEIIVKSMNKNKENSLLLGDLNSLDKSIYTDDEWKKIVEEDSGRRVSTSTAVTDYIKKMNYKDQIPIEHKCSCWNNRKIDYAITDCETKLSFSHVGFLKRLYSDHFPLIVDLKI